ncbi:serine protease [Amycolatopsis sp. NBC_00345]|uniref:serine protease n=1 Tax=Amycolatopsis sp. NBC_00345 TaxID=2975955 RepID=UPI002E257865
MGGVEQSVARVLGPEGAPVGGAFLVAPGVLLTTAHVVSLASGGRVDATAQPGGEVMLSFAGDHDRLVRAEIVHWVPPGPIAPEDIAGLRLLDPAPSGAEPAPLAGLGEPSGRSVTTFGFPGDAPYGGQGHAVLAGPDARGYIQLDSTAESQFTLEQGFSGTPVWDVEDRAVAGLVVEGWTRGRRSGFMIPAPMLLAAWPWLAEQVRPASPFRGLKSFGENDSAVFFGRDELVERFVRRREHTPALTLVGPSGAGKSSVLNAGVIPRLRKAPGLVVVTMRPSQARTPLRAVALALARVAAPGADPLARGARVDEMAARLARGLIGEVVGEVLDKLGGERLVLVVDQLEEALTTTDGELAEFVAVLRHCLKRPAQLDLVAALRSDFLDQVLRHGELAELVQDNRMETVGELSSEALRAAVEEPVRRTRMVRYQDGLVDRILIDVGPKAAGRLPLLQFALAMLWEDQEAGVLTHRAYKAMGGVGSALARHAEAVWDGLGAGERKSAARLLVQLLYPIGTRGEFVRRAAPRAQLDRDQWAAARVLAADRARLVVLREQDTSEVAELAHDALVTLWPLLAELGGRDREFREWQETIRQRIRRDAPPLTGVDLREALQWRAKRRDDLAEAEQRYLVTSRHRRTVRRRRWSAVVVACGLVGTLLVVQRENQTASDAADNLIQAMNRQDPYAQLRTTLRAYRTSANLSTELAITGQYQSFAGTDRILPDFSAQPLVLTGHDPLPREPPSSIVDKVSADGRSLVTTDPQQAVTLWRINGTTVTGKTLDVRASRVTISRDGRYVAYMWSGIDLRPDAPPTCGGVCLYDTVTGRTRQLGTVDVGMISQAPVLRFDPDGTQLTAVYTGDDAIYQHLKSWDVATGAQRYDVAVPAGRLDTVDDMWLAPGGRQVLLNATRPEFPGASLLQTELISVDLTGSSPVVTQLYDGLDSDQFAVSADGRTLALLLPENQDPHTFPEHPRARLAVLDLATLQQTAESPLLPEAQSTGRVALSPHGDQVFLTGVSTVSILPLSRLDQPPVTLPIPGGWQTVLPLDSGPDTPLLVVNSDIDGLVLPAPGRPAPLKRSGSPQPGPDSFDYDGQYDRLTSVLASGVPLPNELKSLPAGTYTGPIGG